MEREDVWGDARRSAGAIRLAPPCGDCRPCRVPWGDGGLTAPADYVHLMPQAHWRGSPRGRDVRGGTSAPTASPLFPQTIIDGFQTLRVQYEVDIQNCSDLVCLGWKGGGTGKACLSCECQPVLGIAAPTPQCRCGAGPHRMASGILTSPCHGEAGQITDNHGFSLIDVMVVFDPVLGSPSPSHM